MKKHLATLLKSYSLEWAKVSRTWILYLTIIYPLFCSAIVFLFSTNSEVNDSFYKFVKTSLQVSIFFLPYYLILIIALLHQIEHRNNTLKLMFVQPVPKWAFYFSKLHILFTMMITSILILIILIFSFGFLLSMIKSGFNVYLDTYISELISKLIFKAYLSSFVLIAIQNWMSFRSKNIILPLAAGVGAIIIPVAVMIILGITGVLKNQDLIEKVFVYNPFSVTYSSIFEMIKTKVENMQYLSKEVIVSFTTGSILIVLWKPMPLI